MIRAKSHHRTEGRRTYSWIKETRSGRQKST